MMQTGRLPYLSAKTPPTIGPKRSPTKKVLVANEYRFYLYYWEIFVHLTGKTKIRETHRGCAAHINFSLIFCTLRAISQLMRAKFLS